MAGPAVEPTAPSQRSIVRVWLALLALTAAEVALAAAGARGGWMLAALLAMSVAKVWLILTWFMHLGFERRTLGWVILPVVVVCILLLLFIVPDSVRLQRMSGAGGTEVKRAVEAK